MKNSEKCIIATSLLVGGTITLWSYVLSDKAKKECEDMLSMTKLLVSAIEVEVICVNKTETLSEDEKVRIVEGVNRKITKVNCILMETAKKRNVFYKKKHIKVASDMVREIYNNLSIKNYGWFYN